MRIGTCTSSFIDVGRFATKSTLFVLITFPERWEWVRCWWFVLLFLTDKDECMYFPCKHGGTCVNNDGSYRCICPPGFTGPTCDLGNFTNLQIVKLVCMYSCTVIYVNEQPYLFSIYDVRSVIWKHWSFFFLISWIVKLFFF